MKKLMAALVLFSLAFFMGCSDPSEEELKKGENLDLERTEGMVVSKSIEYYSGDNTYTKERKGQPCYCLTINVSKDGQGQNFIYKGVSLEKFDSVNVGTRLPCQSMLTVQALATLTGRLLDKQANLGENKFYVVIETLGVTTVYRVNKELYYNIGEPGKVLGPK